MKVVSVTLARGGSKGIPRKNLISIQGRPLIAFTIANARGAAVDEIWVSTNDDEIEKVCDRFGARVLRRPDEISEDTSKCEDALIHFANEVDFDILVFIQNTSPLVTPADIDKGIELVKSGQYDSVFSAYREHWTGRWSLDMTPLNWDPTSRPRRQTMPETLVENGAFYVTTRETLLKTKLRYGGKVGVVEMPYSRSFQIDTEDEVELIKRLVGRWK